MSNLAQFALAALVLAASAITAIVTLPDHEIEYTIRLVISLTGAIVALWLGVSILVALALAVFA